MNKDKEDLTFLCITIFVGSATICLGLSFLSVVLNGEKYVDLFGPSVIGALMVSVVTINSSNFLGEDHM